MLQTFTSVMIKSGKTHLTFPLATIRAFCVIAGASFTMLACSSSGPGTAAGPSAPAAQPSALAGTVDGGGGKGVLCDSGLRTLDLYEGEEVLKLPIVRANLPLGDVLFERGLVLGSHINEIDFSKMPIDQRLKDAFKAEMEDGILNRFTYITPGTHLVPTKDAHLPTLNPGCHEVQIAVYAKDDKIYVDKAYWSALSTDDQAALVLHEWLYRRARQYGALDSDETRGVIARIFAKTDPVPMFSPLWGRNDYLICMGGGGQAPWYGSTYEFFAVADSDNGISGVRFYFRALDGVYLMNRTTAFIPGVGVDDLNWQSQKLFATEVPIQRMSTNNQFVEVTSLKSCGMEFSIRAHLTGSSLPALSHFTCMPPSQHSDSHVCPAN